MVCKYGMHCKRIMVMQRKLLLRLFTILVANPRQLIQVGTRLPPNGNGITGASQAAR